jgi:hypothetical protein
MHFHLAPVLQGARKIGFQQFKAAVEQLAYEKGVPQGEGQLRPALLQADLLACLRTFQLPCLTVAASAMICASSLSLIGSKSLKCAPRLHAAF